MEQMLRVAYGIRSRRSHILEDLGEGVWLFGDGAETAYEPSFERILTLAGLWRLIRHVVRRYITDAKKSPPAPWDYRGSLPGIAEMQLAPQYWIWQTGGLTAKSATRRFDGFVEALIGWHAGQHTDGFALDEVCREIEALVPKLPDGEAKTALIATHVVWHAHVDPADHRPEAVAFTHEYEAVLDTPSPGCFVASLLGNRPMPTWSADEWAAVAQARNDSRHAKNHPPLPAAIDVLIQLYAADELKAAGKHAKALVYAANAVSELPGNEALIAWEARLIADEHDPDFDVNTFLLGQRTAPTSEKLADSDQADEPQAGGLQDPDGQE